MVPVLVGIILERAPNLTTSYLPFQNMGSIYNHPELEMIAKEIQAMLSEKLQIEKEVQDTEYNISVKNTEAHNLQVRKSILTR